MIMSIKLNVDCEESGLNEDSVIDDIVSFATNLVVNGAEYEEIGLKVLEVSYEQ